MRPPDKLAVKQAQRRLKKLRGFAEETRLRQGWIDYIRRTMCLTLSNLARAAALSPATVQQIEKRELSGKVTIETMRKIAAAMDCEFVYAIVPKEDLAALMKRRALAKATRIVREADTHMTLEDQRVTEGFKKRVERIAEDLLAKGDIW